MKNQLKYTEDILFNNYMVSSLGEEYVHSQIPFFIEKNICEDMIFYSERINHMALDILENINGKHKKLLEYFDDFPLRNKIFKLKCPISPMYWSRYDTFVDINNHVYFAEFNYDKPCGQKEIHLAERCNFNGNLNEGFIKRLVNTLLKISDVYCDGNEKINIGFLIDPCHYEELHHSYYFKEILKNTNINIVQVGNNNLSVKDGYVYGYSKIKLQIILRLFPTEFFYEINNIEDILDSFNEGKVLIINDPRIIAIQAKGFFAYLWDLIKNNSNFICEYDKNIIRKSIPYTEIFKSKNLKTTLENKDNYVVKSSLGRYSQEVYIGKSYKHNAWEDEINNILRKDKIHIVQKLINIRQEYTYAPDFKNTNIPILAYGNFGVYLMDKKVEGFLVRWSKDLLTDDNYTWMSPLGTRDCLLEIEKNNFISEKSRINIYEELNEELSFKYNFTGAYSNINEYISLDIMTVTNELYNEIKTTSRTFCEILKKIYPYIQKNIKLFGPILGIPEDLYKIISQSYTTTLCALGRIDFALDNYGDLKILEFNSETPAGIVESIGINSIIKKRFDLKYINPNEDLRYDIKNTLLYIIEEIKQLKEIKNIAVVTSWYYEDIYTTNILCEILKELDNYNIIFGNIYDLDVKNHKIYLYGEEIHAIYRYYPLDWFYYDEEMKRLIEPLSHDTYLINSGHTLIVQSKAFFAVLHEIVNKGIISKEEEEFIVKYIPYTSLEKDKKLSYDYLIKPYLSREGDGVHLDYEYTYNNNDDVIFQDRVNIKPIKMELHSVSTKENKYQFPILGAYITNDKFSGIYTRMGDIITDKNARYISTYIK
ncbi:MULTISPECIES: glutathionylspermidine synthase family protein [Clostridium]|uniref:glutathionylspermidine synthase family protein n=1 Tax=Clostridium TaxID=1485 RepID=UPI000772FA93|nr:MULTISPECIES: glutathionylspermidine synthase family protein [Clostridium]MBY7023678.1 glutathionylspermidine synthase family protein [Clostridium botulinum]NFE96343.1 glutathionylspermidine synthase family protein [Clostridium botulinum]NFL39883.1 glutathionylspermidine synthase family protein [Clostridium botulinum]NFL66872.1 glutathionylspermidine synthase family protein [Clostridium botulinum]NFN09759.1 glutathionylspermidine synthase family protein [Clostridium botulinum]